MEITVVSLFMMKGIAVTQSKNALNSKFIGTGSINYFSV